MVQTPQLYGMRNFAPVICWGFIISALGSIPLGTLNVTAMQVSVEKGLNQAIFFSLGVALIEIAYVRLCLVAIHWIRQHVQLLYIMNWIAVLIVLLLSAGSFTAAFHPTHSSNFILDTHLPFFLLGLLMSALNPVQLPFWMGWSTWLFSRGTLHARSDYYNWYVLGIGLGTLSGLALFIYGGMVLVGVLNTKQQLINLVIGSVFLLTAFFQVVKIIRHKGLAETANEKGADLEAAEENDR